MRALERADGSVNNARTQLRAVLKRRENCGDEALLAAPVERSGTGEDDVHLGFGQRHEGLPACGIQPLRRRNGASGRPNVEEPRRLPRMAGLF
jgi:hypothetical protein